MFDKIVKIKDVKLEIGQLVRSLRKKEGLTQEDLANLLELSRITIQNLEAGKNFTIDTLLKVLRHFDLLNTLLDVVIDKKIEIKNLKSLY